MLSYVEYRIQPRYVKALNFEFSRQRIVGKARDHTACIADGSAQLGNELSPGDGASLRELAGALPVVLRSAEAGNDPLADISAQVQDEVARAVGRRIGPPPNFFLGKLLKAFHDAGKILFRHAMLRTRKK